MDYIRRQLVIMKRNDILRGRQTLKKILEGQINRLPLYKKERCPFPDINTWRDDYYKYYEYKLDKSDIMEMCNTWINTIIWKFVLLL